jgi:hypothetical protein
MLSDPLELRIMTGYEASERFWAHIIMHMLIMRIIPIIMLSLRLNFMLSARSFQRLRSV